MLNHANIRLVAPYRVPGIRNTSILKALEYLEDKKIIGIDCETAPKEEFKT